VRFARRNLSVSYSGFEENGILETEGAALFERILTWGSRFSERFEFERGCPRSNDRSATEAAFKPPTSDG